ncbi:hypothetical protein [Streptomyces sp. CC77]|uniref:hypothetical protein n=1 Tax=Streptomyces sp. CC77 TaxID=1906739 RepID=UPI0008DDE659|nr:hypothetical protein [Streptomyces sp. CC77]OII69720.1 hypothetical protein BJP39_16395 [Streptomyces sp. CC77]
MHVTGPSSGRVLARLLPALLCALCAFLVPPASAPAGPPAAVAAPTAGPHSPVAGAASGEPAAGQPVLLSTPPTRTDADPAAGSGPRVTGAEAVELPAAVEQSVRLPAPPPAAPQAVRGADQAPGRGRVEGDPRRERAPPGLPYDPTAPRGPPSTRHS